MTGRSTARTQPCAAEQARVRLRQARAFVEVAELVAENPDDLATPGVAASLAVLAGIAAADAACCVVLGIRWRGQDHRQAVGLLAQVGSDGQVLARALARLLDLKDGAHYGMVYVSRQKSMGALRQARALTAAAETLTRRRS